MRKDCGNCPIALALYREPGVVEVTAHPGRIFIRAGDLYFSTNPYNKGANDFMYDFDKGFAVKPTTFEITFVRYR